MKMLGFGWNGGDKKPSSKTDTNNELTIVPKVVGVGALVAGCYWLYEQLQPVLEPDQVVHADGNKTDMITNSNIDFASLLLGTGGVIGGSAALSAAGWYYLHKYYKDRALKEIRYIKITPHASTYTTKDSINSLMRAFWREFRPTKERLLRGREWFQLLFHCVEGEHPDGDIHIYLGFPQDRTTDVQENIKKCYPSCEITVVPYQEVPVKEESSGSGGSLYWSKPKNSGFPLKAFDGKDHITPILKHLRPGTTMGVVFSPTSTKKLKKTVVKTEQHYLKAIGFDPKTMKKSDLTGDAKDHIQALDDQKQSNLSPFEVQIFLWQEEGKDYILESIVNNINHFATEDKSLHRKRHMFKKDKYPFALSPYPSFFDKKMIWTGDELGNLFHLPNGPTKEQIEAQMDHIYKRIPHIALGQMMIDSSEFKRGVKLGSYLNPAQNNRDIHISEDTLRKMGLIVGKTGSGKTALIKELMDYLVLERLKHKTGGYTAIDPKGDLVKTQVTYYNKLRKEGLLTEKQEKNFHVFDVLNPTHTFAINPMYKPKNVLSRDEAGAIVDRAMSVLAMAFPSESIYFERYGRLAMKALLADRTTQHTIFGIPELLKKESPLRDRLISQLSSGTVYEQEIVRDLLENSKAYGGNEVQPVINRLVKLKENAVMRRIFGQKETTVEVLKYMEEGHITLFNVEGLSKDQMKLVIGYLLMEYHLKCKYRKNTSQNHYLIIDEAHEVQLPVLWEHIIPKDRDKGLNLIMLTQALHQFAEPLLLAITDVGGGLFASCISGEKTAKTMEKATTGRAKSHVIQNLQPLTAIMDVEDSRGKRVTFQVKAAPPFIYDENGEKTYFGTDKIRQDAEKEAAFTYALENIAYSWMKRDCRLVAEVEREIDDYTQSLWKTNEKEKEAVGFVGEASEKPRWNLNKEKKDKVINLFENGGEE
jgi:hypothetical protein